MRMPSGASGPVPPEAVLAVGTSASELAASLAAARSDQNGQNPTGRAVHSGSP